MASIPSSSVDKSVPWESPDQIQEIARQTVDASPRMYEIRRAIEAKGLDPIWVRLISEFGSLMYVQGRLSRRSSNSLRVSERSSSDGGFQRR